MAIANYRFVYQLNKNLLVNMKKSHTIAAWFFYQGNIFFDKSTFGIII